MPGDVTMPGDDLLFATPRLTVPRRWRPQDLQAYAQLNADPAVMEYLGGVALTRQQSDEFARYGQEWHEREGLGLLPVLRRDDGVLLGMCGLHRHRWYPADVEVGWRFARHAWGAGYATESATRWLDHAFGPLALPRVISITDPRNTRSLAVMTRLGLHVDHAARHGSTRRPVDVVVHAVTAAQWRTARQG